LVLFTGHSVISLTVTMNHTPNWRNVGDVASSDAHASERERSLSIASALLAFPVSASKRNERERETASYAREKFEIRVRRVSSTRPACGLIAPLYFLFRAVDR